MIYLDKFNGYTIKCFLVTTGNVGKKLSAEYKGKFSGENCYKL